MSRVARLIASDGERDFLWESYTLEGRHRARLTLVEGGPVEQAGIGTGKDQTEALLNAWAAWRQRYGPHT